MIPHHGMYVRICMKVVHNRTHLLVTHRWLVNSGGMTDADIRRHLPQISDESIVAGDKKETLHDLYSHLYQRQ